MMKKLLTAIILLCFSVAANAEVWVCTEKKSSLTTAPSSIENGYNVYIYDLANGYIVDTDRGMRRFNAGGSTQPDPFVGSCEITGERIRCDTDPAANAIQSLLIDIDGERGNFSFSSHVIGFVSASVGTCIKI